MTPLQSLKSRIAEEIRTDGPISLATYMERALTDPQGGYYMARDPLGHRGDFITAPEVSQVFGEMIGLWFAQRWLDLGRPSPIHIVELGPGRGTLQADFQRAIQKALPDFWQAAQLHLVEASPHLKEKQSAALAGLSANEIAWHGSFSTIPQGALFVVANEFFDALPIRQFVNREGKWHERLVTVSGANMFSFVDALDPTPEHTLPAPMRDAANGSIAEICQPAQAIVSEMAKRLCGDRGQALIIDYGYIGSQAGDTFQAVKAHEFVDPFNDPGEADLTAHVDFTTLANIAAAEGAVPSQIVTQSEFLVRIGIEARVQQLTATASDRQKTDLEAGLQRLIDQDAMGTLFKVLALAPPNLPPPPGFTLY